VPCYDLNVAYQPPKNTTEMAQLFDQLFGDVFRMTSGGPGGDDSVTLELSDEEAATGVTREVAIQRQVVCAGCSGRGSANEQVEPAPCVPCGGTGRRQQTMGAFLFQASCSECGGMGRPIQDPCATCEGRGFTTPTAAALTVVVPPGVTHGQTLRLDGAGATGPDGTRGSVFVFLLIGGLPDPRFAAIEPPAADLPRARLHRPTRASRAMIAFGILLAALILVLVLLSR
jgi:DnaJ-class molecular chaperone